MTYADFLDGCRFLMKLRPTVYRWNDLKFWPYSQLAEELATVAQEEDRL